MGTRTPQDIAREAVKLLTTRKLPPTPDHFQNAYHEVAGTKPLRPFPLEQWRQITGSLPDKTPAQQRLKRHLGQAVSMHSWEGVNKALATYLGPASTSATPSSFALLETMEPAPMPAAEVLQTLPADLREQIARIVDHSLPAVGNDDAKIVEQAQSIVNYLRLPSQEPAALRKMLAEFSYRLSFVAEEQALIRSTLLNLLRLVLQNIHDLSPDNPWLKRQMEALIHASSPPLSVRRLEELERQLRDVIHKQSEASQRTQEARETIKVAISSFISRLGEMSEHGDHYQEKIETFAKRLESASDLAELAPVVQDAIQATRAMVIDTQRANDEMHELRERSNQAELEIQRLQDELDRLSAAVSHDMLTGALNRRGLDDVISRELARVQRLNSSLCLALLDIDDFKRINDQHGHDTGDAALKHLADVARTALRPSDSLARFGGEEFVIVLPDTSLEEGAEVIRRLQRELTKAYFMKDSERLLITFSAGVTLVTVDDDGSQALRRADQAMYLAKRTGKNRVVGA